MNKQEILKKIKESDSRIVRSMSIGEVGYIKCSGVVLIDDNFFVDGDERYTENRAGVFSVKISRDESGFCVHGSSLEGEVEYISRHNMFSHRELLPAEIV